MDHSTNGSGGGSKHDSDTREPTKTAKTPPTNNNPTRAHLKRIDAADDRYIFACLFLLVTGALLLIVSYFVIRFKDSSDVARPNTVLYFFLCLLGGMISGVCHVLMVPLDLLKVRAQGGVAASVADAWCAAKVDFLLFVGKKAGCGGDGGGFLGTLRMLWLRLSATWEVFFVGFGPSVVGYTIQGGVKYLVYEILKFKLAANFSYEFVADYRVLFFFVSSGLAELTADFCLAPFEGIKVAVQTSPPLLATSAADDEEAATVTVTRPPPQQQQLPPPPPPPRYVTPRIAFLRLYLHNDAGWRAFYACLVPLLLRQVPLTMIKFTMFEKAVEYFFHFVVVDMSHTFGLGWENRIAHHDAPVVAKLIVATLAGFVSGFFCAVVSCPADVLVSRMASGRSKSLLGAFNDVGGATGLFAGLGARIAMVGVATTIQWLSYESFKVAVGLPTTGTRSVGHR